MKLVLLEAKAGLAPRCSPIFSMPLICDNVSLLVDRGHARG